MMAMMIWWLHILVIHISSKSIINSLSLSLITIAPIWFHLISSTNKDQYFDLNWVWQLLETYYDNKFIVIVILKLEAKIFIAQLVPFGVFDGGIQSSNPPSLVGTIELSKKLFQSLKLSLWFVSSVYAPIPFQDVVFGFSIKASTSWSTFNMVYLEVWNCIMVFLFPQVQWSIDNLLLFCLF